jgi:hypothetical protein
MGRSDLDAVAARRAALVGERAKLDQTRADLIEEDQELEMTERVLRRLGELHYREPALVADTSTDAPSALHNLLERGLSGGRGVLQRLRSAVERRTD